MRFTTYSKYHPELADAVNLQGLLDQLSDFLLQSGFAGNSPSFWHDDMGESERSLDALRQAILQALMDSGQLTPDMLKVLRGESTGTRRGTGDRGRAASCSTKIVQRLMRRAITSQAPQVTRATSDVGPAQAHSAAQQVQSIHRTASTSRLKTSRPARQRRKSTRSPRKRTSPRSRGGGCEQE